MIFIINIKKIIAIETLKNKIIKDFLFIIFYKINIIIILFYNLIIFYKKYLIYFKYYYRYLFVKINIL